MTNNGKARPLPAIIGERLKAFRDEKDLRQADLASAAASVGLPWSRSSVAALEAGTRNLSFEEMLLIPTVVSRVGGWDKPIVPADEKILIGSGYHIIGNRLVRAMENLFVPTAGRSAEAGKGGGADVEVDELGQDFRKNGEGLADARLKAEHKAWGLFLRTVYGVPDRGSILHQAINGNSELRRKVADRLEVPDTVAKPWNYAAYLPGSLWGRTFDSERDARTEERGSYETKRSLQAARGHVTREMISELNEEIERKKGELEEVFGPLGVIWDDEDQIREWLSEVGDQPEREESVIFKPALGAVLREVRERAGLSPEAFSVKSHISIQKVHEIERGEFRNVEEAVAKVFVRQYGNFSNADPLQLEALFDDDGQGEPNHRKSKRWRKR